MSFASLPWVKAGFKKADRGKNINLLTLPNLHGCFLCLRLWHLYKKVLPEYGKLAFGDLLLWSFRAAPTKKGGELLLKVIMNCRKKWWRIV